MYSSTKMPEKIDEILRKKSSERPVVNRAQRISSLAQRVQVLVS